MTVTVTPVDRDEGNPGSGDGEDAYTSFGHVNDNEANFKAAIEELQGRHFTIQNAGATAALGKRYMCNSHGGITLTLPATFAASSTDFFRSSNCLMYLEVAP